MSNVLGDWKPYSGGKPADPAPLGEMPKGGFKNPRFKQIGPMEVSPPAGGYKSIISTAPPLDQAKLNRISNVTQSFKGGYGGGAGDRSRAAFSRAMADTSKTGLMKAADNYNTEYQKQAEKSRAEDLQAQRSNATDRFRMDSGAAVYEEDTKTAYSEGIKDGSQNFETEKRNEEAKRTAMALSFLGGLL